MTLRWIVGVVLLFASTAALAEHDKTDIATTADGSTYVGEIKVVRYATLVLDTDPAGLLNIEWRHVTGLTSKFEYRVELTGGVVHFGKLGRATKSGQLSIVGDSGTIEAGLSEVVEITPIGHGFWHRLDGSVSFGLTYTQANNALQYNFNGNATYRSQKNFASLIGQSIFSTQSGGEATNQHDLKLVVAQVPPLRWGVFELGQLQSNPDQGYDLRSILGGGATNFFVESSKKLATVNLGAVYNHENVADGGGTENSIEALVGIEYRRFKRGSYSPNVQVGLATFTNVTDTPRFRAVLNFVISWQVVNNLTLDFQVNDSYDSNPPGTDSENNDLSLVTSFGYTF